MLKTIAAIIALSFAVPAFAAACTVAEAQQKSQDLQAALIQAQQKDPSKSQAMMAKIQAFMQKYQNEASPSDAACADIDKLISDIKGS
jgi:hypothetical protein